MAEDVVTQLIGYLVQLQRQWR